MNHEAAMKVADAVLYEGYMLYPYRPSSIKNRQRWSFGILYPPNYEEVARGTERAHMHTEFLLQTSKEAKLHIQLRFLHLMAREVMQAHDEQLERVSSIVVQGRRIDSMEEGVERSVQCEASAAAECEQHFTFEFAGLDEAEPVRDGGETVAQLMRSQDQIKGAIRLCAERAAGGILKLSLDVENLTVLPAYAADRDSALLSSFLSAHAILSVSKGEFISLLEPPEELRDVARACKNIGNFPVLVGLEGARDTLLCSPILLYDYPQIAPESAGDFYDATEMDEMLTLRVLTLTDDEKDEIRMAGEHSRNLLQRTEETAREQLMRTHGTIRSLRAVGDQQ